MAKNKIIFVIDVLHGTSYHRLTIPSVSMADAGYSVGGVQSIEQLFYRKDLNEVAAVVFSRFAIVSNHQNLKKWLNKMGIKMIVDLDDRWHLDGDKKNFREYNEMSRPFIEKSLKIADIVWCASKYLANKVSKTFNIPRERVFYIPNGINPNINGWETEEQPRGEKPVFGYIAAIGHDKDLQPLKGLFNEQKMITMRFEGGEKAGHLDYASFLGTEAVGIPPLPLHEYGNLYHDINVSIAPLAKTDFNMCKSSLKIQEAGFKKRALMCSDVPLYNDIIEHGKTGIICKYGEDWKREIDAMTTEKAIDLGEALYERVKDEFNVHTINKLRVESIFK